MQKGIHTSAGLASPGAIEQDHLCCATAKERLKEHSDLVAVRGDYEWTAPGKLFESTEPLQNKNSLLRSVKHVGRSLIHCTLKVRAFDSETGGAIAG